jgi:hypothetical protein
MYERLVAAAKPPKVAYIAIARKLLTILNAMVRDGTNWATRHNLGRPTSHGCLLGGGHLSRVQPLLRYLPDVGIEVRQAVDGIGIVGTSVGVVSGQDLLDATARLREEVEGNPRIRYAVMDFSAIPEANIATESLRVLATQRIESVSGIFVVVVASSEVLFGLSRMWEMLAEREGLISRVVRTRAEAITWLQDELTQQVDPFRLTE